jgi:hypothetical protein
LAYAYDIEQDEIHKESIVRYIEQHVDSVSAVLILIDHLSLGPPFSTSYMWSVLSTILPKTLVNNTALIFTNYEDNFLYLALDLKFIPEALKSSPVFHLINPIAQPRSGVKDCEQRALEMLVKVFNWLDGLEPHPATEITSLYEVYQNIEVNTISLLYQRVREVEIDTLTIALKRNLAVGLSLCSHLALQS